MFFNLLHRTFGIERMDDDLVVIEARLMRHGFPRILGSSRELKRFGSMEGSGEADFADLGAMNLRISLARNDTESSCTPLRAAFEAAVALELPLELPLPALGFAPAIEVSNMFGESWFNRKASRTRSILCNRMTDPSSSLLTTSLLCCRR